MSTYDRDALLAQLKIDEDLKLFPYRDSKGLLTIGIGRNIQQRGITEEEAEFLCSNDINDCEASLDAHLPWWRQMSDARQRGLVNLCFNMGWTTLGTFRTMLAALESGDYAFAADDLLQTLYARQVGARAQRIADLFRNG